MTVWHRRAAVTAFVAIAVTAGLVVTSGQQKAAPARQSSADALLGTGQYQEQVEGKLDAAIATYKKVLAAADATKAQKARAQLHIGLCYERLGMSEARKAYEAVVRDYGDQLEAVKTASIRLAALAVSGSDAGPVPKLRQLWANEEPLCGAWLSPDGNRLLLSDPGSGKTRIRDIATGAVRAVALPPPTAWLAAAIWSPDSRQIAFVSSNGDGLEEIRALDVQTGISRTVLTTRDRIRHDGLLSCPTWEVLGWSPDGNQIAATTAKEASCEGGAHDLVFVSAEGGRQTLIKPLSASVNGFAFSPTGTTLAYSATETVRVLDVVSGSETVVVPGFARNRLVGWTPDGSGVLFTSDRGGGNGLWFVAAGRTAVHQPAPVRLSEGRMIPVGLTRSGSFVYEVPGTLSRHVYVATVDIATGKVTGAPRQITDEAFSNNDWPRWSADGERLAFVSAPGERQPMGFLSVWSFDTGQTRRFSLPEPAGGAFTTLEWAPDDRTIIYRFFRRIDETGLCRIDSVTGQSSRLAVESSGRPIQAWATDGAKVFHYTRTDKRITGIRSREVATGLERAILTDFRVDVGVRSWSVSADNRLLAVSTPLTAGSSSVVVVPVDGGTARTVCQLPELPASIAWARDGRGLLVTSAWTAREANTEVWYCSLQGDTQPHKLDLPPGQMRGAALHPDGRTVAYTRYEAVASRGVWIMENFLPRAKAGTKRPQLPR